MSEEDERERLRSIVFEGAPDWCTHAAMEDDGIWFWLEMPWTDWINGATGNFDSCKNQPETTLDWTQTLIER